MFTLLSYLFDKDSQSLQDDNHNGIGLQNNLKRKFHCFDKESLSMVSVDEIKCCSNSNLSLFSSPERLMSVNEYEQK